METKFGERLARHIGDRTTMQVAAKVTVLGYDCTKENVQRWLDGDGMPRAEAIPYLARALDCTADALLGTNDV